MGLTWNQQANGAAVETKIDHLVSLFESPAEAMKYAVQFIRIKLHQFKRVIPGVPLMNYDVAAAMLYRKIEPKKPATKVYPRSETKATRICARGGPQARLPTQSLSSFSVIRGIQLDELPGSISKRWFTVFARRYSVEQSLRPGAVGLSGIFVGEYHQLRR